MTRRGMLTKNVDLFLQGSTENGAIDSRVKGAVQRQGVLNSPNAHAPHVQYRNIPKADRKGYAHISYTTKQTNRLSD